MNEHPKNCKYNQSDNDNFDVLKKVACLKKLFFLKKKQALQQQQFPKLNFSCARCFLLFETLNID